MARFRKSRSYQSRPTRPLPNTSLGHTVGRVNEFSGPSEYDSPVVFPSRTVRPLIRTVLVEREPLPQAPPRRGKRGSPTVSVRATFRSNDRRIKSPFLNATMVTPELTERAIVCAKRGIRREVLFARKQTGKGAKSPKRQPSKVRC